MEPGDVALFRFIRFGKVRHASPRIVVRDDEDVVVLHLPVGTQAKLPGYDGRPIRGQADRHWELHDHAWHTSSLLTVIPCGRAHCIDLLWDSDTGAFAGWYVNIQEPIRRSRLGFDTDDLVLDITVQPDGSWQWKDGDELEEAVRLGRFTGMRRSPSARRASACSRSGRGRRAGRTGGPIHRGGCRELPDGWNVV